MELSAFLRLPHLVLRGICDYYSCTSDLSDIDHAEIIFGFVFRIWDAVCALARDGHDMYMEGQPERDLRKELRVQERRQRREERQAQRVRELEEALAQENNDEEEAAAKEKKSTGFLEGTLLVPPEAKKKKNRKTVLRDHKKTAEGIKMILPQIQIP